MRMPAPARLLPGVHLHTPSLHAPANVSSPRWHPCLAGPPPPPPPPQKTKKTNPPTHPPTLTGADTYNAMWGFAGVCPTCNLTKQWTSYEGAIACNVPKVDLLCNLKDTDGEAVNCLQRVVTQLHRRAGVRRGVPFRAAPPCHFPHRARPPACTPPPCRRRHAVRRGEPVVPALPARDQAQRCPEDMCGVVSGAGLP